MLNAILDKWSCFCFDSKGQSQSGEDATCPEIFSTPYLTALKEVVLLSLFRFLPDPLFLVAYY